MKRTAILLIIALTCRASTQAQQFSNPGFELWDTLELYTQPTSWFTLNPLAAFGFDPSTTLTSDAHSGNYAVELTTISGQFTDYSGVLCTGPILDQDLQPDFSKMKVPFTARPSHLKFYYKAFPALGDTGALTMCLTKWNATLGLADTIAEASILMGSVVSEYTLAEIVFQYRNDQLPDSMFLIASSSLDGFNPTPESKLLLDDLELVYLPTGIKSLSKEWALEVFPNPVTSKLTVRTPNRNTELMLYDITGKVCKKQSSTMMHQVLLSDQPEGIYFVVVKDEEGNTQTRKITVKH